MLTTYVARKWLKMKEYLEFWKDFSYSGKSQVSYMFQKRLISVLIDFYLDDQSPIKLINDDKRIKLGNQHTNPFWDPLIQIISVLLRNSELNKQMKGKQYKLTNLDIDCINCLQFYRKTIQEKYDLISLSNIVELVAFKNEPFSTEFAKMLIRSLNQSSPEEIRPFLDIFIKFINIKDEFMDYRIEWLIGYPQAKPLVAQFRNEKFPQFGTYGINNLDEPWIIYKSNVWIYSYNTLTDIMIKNRKQNTNSCITCLKALLECCLENDRIMDYVVKLPPPTFIFAKFYDWIKAFLEKYSQDIQGYYNMTFQGKEMANETLGLFSEFMSKLKKMYPDIYLTEDDKIESQEKQKQENIIKSEIQQKNTPASVPSQVNQQVQNKNPIFTSFIYKKYLIGITSNEEVVHEKTFNLEQGIFKLLVTNLETYLTDSKPNGKTNLAIPSEITSNQIIFESKVDNKSSTNFFIATYAGCYGSNVYNQVWNGDRNFANLKQHNQKNRFSEEDQQIQNQGNYSITLNDSEDFIIVELDKNPQEFTKKNTELIEQQQTESKVNNQDKEQTKKESVDQTDDQIINDCFNNDNVEIKIGQKQCRNSPTVLQCKGDEMPQQKCTNPRPPNEIEIKQMKQKGRPIKMKQIRQREREQVIFQEDVNQSIRVEIDEVIVEVTDEFGEYEEMKVIPRQSLVDHLKTYAFPEYLAKQAVINTNNSGINQALDEVLKLQDQGFTKEQYLEKQKNQVNNKGDEAEDERLDDSDSEKGETKVIPLSKINVDGDYFDITKTQVKQDSSPFNINLMGQTIPQVNQETKNEPGNSNPQQENQGPVVKEGVEEEEKIANNQKIGVQEAKEEKQQDEQKNANNQEIGVQEAEEEKQQDEQKNANNQEIGVQEAEEEKQQDNNQKIGGQEAEEEKQQDEENQNVKNQKNPQNIPYYKGIPIRRIVCMNYSRLEINCKLQIQADQKSVNFQVPKSTIRFKINPRGNKVIYCLVKYNPKQAWGEMKINFAYDVLLRNQRRSN